MQLNFFACVNSVTYFCYVYDVLHEFWCDQNIAHNFFAHPHFQYCIKCFWILKQHSIRNLLPIVIFHWCTTSFFCMCQQHDILLLGLWYFQIVLLYSKLCMHILFAHLYFQYCIKCFWILRQHSIRNLLPIVIFHSCATSFFLHVSTA